MKVSGKTFLCKLGIHKWFKDKLITTFMHTVKQCSKCGQIEVNYGYATMIYQSDDVVGESYRREMRYVFEPERYHTDVDFNQMVVMDLPIADWVGDETWAYLWININVRGDIELSGVRSLYINQKYDEYDFKIRLGDNLEFSSKERCYLFR